MNRDEIIKLLKEDEAFRVKVVEILTPHFIGLLNLATKSDIKAVLKEIRNLREDTNKRFEENDRRFRELIKEMREEFASRDKRFEELTKEMREEFASRDKRFEELTKEMREEFASRDKRFEESDKRFMELIKEMREGFDRLDRRLIGFGARWGIESEEAYRSAMKSIIEREFGAKVRKWNYKMMVEGGEKNFEIDLVISDEKHILTEIKSSVSYSELQDFILACKIYEKEKNIKPHRKIIVTAYAEDKARTTALKEGIEIFSG